MTSPKRIIFFSFTAIDILGIENKGLRITI